MAHIRQSRPDSGLGIPVQGLKTFRVVPSSGRKPLSRGAREVEGAPAAPRKEAEVLAAAQKQVAEAAAAPFAGSLRLPALVGNLRRQGGGTLASPPPHCALRPCLGFRVEV